MAELKTDIERMIMRACYQMQLEAEASPAQVDPMWDMEREGYIRRMNELLDAVQSLLDANTKMGEKLERMAEDYEQLKVKYARLEGEFAMR